MSERHSSGEDEWLHEALRQFAPPGGGALPLGHDVGAAPVGADRMAVLSTDVLVDGVHFQIDECGPATAARKALAVNLSDLAAAAAIPVGFLVGAVLPRPASRALFDALMTGFATAARDFACPCLGGDTNAGPGPLVLSVTVLGRQGPGGLVTRSGARVGDVLSVTGPLGGSRLGRHLAAQPRVREALLLAEANVPHAMMDLSDGLSRDLPRLCRASGVGARLDAKAIPVHADALRVASEWSPLQHALHDGEDFELLVAHAAIEEPVRVALREQGVRLVPIGSLQAQERGIVLAQAGSTTPLEPRGWDHVAG